MAKDVKDKDVFIATILRVRELEVKILRGEKLTEEEESRLWILLGVRRFKVDKRGRTVKLFKDDEQRDRFIERFWEEAEKTKDRFELERAQKK